MHEAPAALASRMPRWLVLCLAACSAPPPPATTPEQPSTSPASSALAAPSPDVAPTAAADPAAAPPIADASERAQAKEPPPCANRRPLAEVCPCLRAHVSSWGEGITSTCRVARRIDDARILQVSTQDRHAGVQWFIAQEGPSGTSVLALLAHHVPGGGGVYRTFTIDDARVEKLGGGRVLRVDATEVETEIPAGKRGASAKRELGRSTLVTICALGKPAGGDPECLDALPLRERGVDEDTGRLWERTYDLRIDDRGKVSHVPLKGGPGDKATSHDLFDRGGPPPSK